MIKQGPVGVGLLGVVETVGWNKFISKGELRIQ